MRAIDLMTQNPATLRDDATIRDAVELLQSLDVRHLPVVNDEQELVGMLSDRDLRGLAFPRVEAGELLGSVQQTLDASIATVMSSDVVSVEEQADVADIADLMLENKVGAVPVTNEDGELVGIVSYVDLLRRAKFS